MSYNLTKTPTHPRIRTQPRRRHHRSPSQTPTSHRGLWRLSRYFRALRLCHHDLVLPSPEAFAAYNEAQPGTSERLIKLAERQQLFQMLELALSFGLIAFGIAGSIWGPGMGANPLAVGGLPLAAGLAVAAVTSARRFQRRPPSG